MYNSSSLLKEQIERISRVDTDKCMKCGKCTASCPAAFAMDIKPHQFVSYVNRGEIEPLQKSETLWKCLSCFTCIQRCPRDVKPGKLIEAVRLSVIRERDGNYLSPDEIPELLDPEIPQQLLVSAARKWTR